MNQEQKDKLKGLAIAGALVFAAWKFGPNQAVKAAALGVAGVMVAKQVPFVNRVI